MKRRGGVNEMEMYKVYYVIYFSGRPSTSCDFQTLVEAENKEEARAEIYRAAIKRGRERRKKDTTLCRSRR